MLFSVGLIPENELTKDAGIELNRSTKGATVYQNRETTSSGRDARRGAAQTV
mgnify:CR=1 FL=1